MSMKRRIAPEDILPNSAYAQVRRERRQAVIEQKRRRRVEIGPVATAQFETYDTMLLQVQEMLFIEKGGEAQIEDELRAYNPLIPDGRELVATVMFEIDDPARRKAFLSRIGGIEHTVFLRFAGETVKGVPESDQERTDETGKASAVHFIHFPFTEAQIAAFRRPGTEVVMGFSHPEYAHMTVLPEPVRAALAEDFEG
ncbi:MAG: DUF3501 family protein [Rhodospirillaceae bacterium]|nr:DUF3501 family protein [Rhodospirillaceae bacterium]